MTSDMPTTRELLAKVGPRVVTPPMLTVANRLLAASVGLCLFTVGAGGLMLLRPSSKAGLLPVAQHAYLLGIGLFIGWAVLNIVALGHLLWRSTTLLADQLDAQMAADRQLVELLAGSGTVPDLQRLGRHVAFAARMGERFGTTVAIAAGLGAAITATAAALPIGAAQIGGTLKVTIPALLLGAAIAGALRHGFGLRLLRLAFVLAEAERPLSAAAAAATPTAARAADLPPGH